MRLQTLGSLSLQGSAFRRSKPLLLLAYMALNGPQPKRWLAALFWSEAENPMNSLATALSQLRRAEPGVTHSSETHAWSEVDCDALELRTASNAGQLEQVIKHYAGSFVSTLDLEIGIELQEWLYQTREELASRVRIALLQLAERHALQGRFDEAGQFAQHAYQLPGAAALEPELIPRLQVLLQAANHVLGATLAEEANSLGLQLELSADEARGRLRQRLIGRGLELERLGTLGLGEWAWVGGRGGMGKTALLKHLSGQYLPARSDLPYASLEPVLAGLLGQSEQTMLHSLRQAQGTWLLDDWQRFDPESRSLISQLRSLRPNLRLVIGSSEALPFKVDMQLELGPLSFETMSRESFEAHQDTWERTGGLPSLLGALLSGEAPERALAAKLESLPDQVQDVYLAFSLLEQANPALIRKALKLEAQDMAQVLEQLISEGLVSTSGQARARGTALAYLEAHPARLGTLALALARSLEGSEAFALYQRSRLLWEAEDEQAVIQAYLAWAGELLRRGFPQRAADLLLEAPKHDRVQLLRARALEQTGHYREALNTLELLPEEPEVLALTGALYWRLGQPELARQTSERCTEGDLGVRAEAQNTLGALALSEGAYAQALKLFRKAATLWLALNQRDRAVGSLNNAAVARIELGEEAEDAFQDALETAGQHQSLQAVVHLNFGLLRERKGQIQDAQADYTEAARLALEAGAIATAARAWNNHGALLHRQEQRAEAQISYNRALELAQQSSEQLIVAMVLANIAELRGDNDALEEAIRILTGAGHLEMAQRYRAQLTEN